jgi:hypothetical protein
MHPAQASLRRSVEPTPYGATLPPKLWEHEQPPRVDGRPGAQQIGRRDRVVDVFVVDREAGGGDEFGAVGVGDLVEAEHRDTAGRRARVVPAAV